MPSHAQPAYRQEWLRRAGRSRLLIGMAAISLLLAGSRMAAAESWRDEAFLAGLRARRLFELAEAHCERRHADRSLGVVERGELTVDWIRTLAEHARHSPATQREALLRRAHEVASQFTTAHPEHSLGFLVRTQEAIADATAGELARLEAEASPDPAAERAAARKRCRAAAIQLEQLDRQLAEFLPQRFRRGNIPDELAVEQLASLQHQIRLQAARAHRGLALAYDESSDDWLAALGRGLQLLEPSLRQLTPDMPLFAPLTLEAATHLRLLGRGDAARAMLTRLAPEPPRTGPALTGVLQWAVMAEQLRTAVGQRQWTEAERLAANQPTSSSAAVHRSSGSDRTPVETVAGAAAGTADSASSLTGFLDDANPAKADWDFARFEALIARWRFAAAADVGANSSNSPASTNPNPNPNLNSNSNSRLNAAVSDKAAASDISSIREQAITLLDQIEAEHGVYWKHRGDLLLVSIGAATGTRDADLLGRAADSLLAQDRVEEALKAYEQAAAAATSEQNRDAAFHWAYKAGLVQQRRQSYEDAAERLRVAALAHPDHAQAPLAHLAALWNLAQAMRQPVSSTADAAAPSPIAQAAKRYSEWLEDHPRRWPASPTCSEAQAWRGAWLEARGDWAAASAAYHAVPETHAAALDAYRGILRTETRRLAAAVESLGQAPDKTADKTAGKTAGKTADKTADKTAGEKAGEKASKTAGETTGAKAIREMASLSTPDRKATGPLHEGPAAVGAQIEIWLNKPVPANVANMLTGDDQRTVAHLRFLALWVQPGRESDARRAWLAVSMEPNMPAFELVREWLVMAQRLRTAGDTARRAALAPLALSLVDTAGQLRPSANSATDNALVPKSKMASAPSVDELFATVHAEALEDSGQQAEAIAVWRQVASKHPKSGSAQQSFAEALERSPRREDWLIALDQWRRVAAKSAPRSSRWFRAKLGTVQQLVRLDQRAEAEKLVRFLLESPPPPPEVWRKPLETAVALPRRE